METPPIDERPVFRKLISDALFRLADDIDIHAAQESISYNKLTATPDPKDQDKAGQHMSQRHMWFSTRGGFGQQTYPYGQTLVIMAVRDLGLDEAQYKEYFRSEMVKDNYNIGSYMTRVKEKTADIRRLAVKLVAN